MLDVNPSVKLVLAKTLMPLPTPSATHALCVVTSVPVGQKAFRDGSPYSASSFGSTREKSPDSTSAPATHPHKKRRHPLPSDRGTSLNPLSRPSTDCRVLLDLTDWSETSLGPRPTWSPVIEMMVNIVMSSRTQDAVWLGQDFNMIYNENYSTIVDHPAVFGRSANSPEAWGPVWESVGDLIDRCVNGGEACYRKDHLLLYRRSPKGLTSMLDGQEIPQFGLGVFKMSDKETYDCVKHALKVGYRHIDTAESYGNEEPCGRAIRDFMKETGTHRSEIFLTSKLKHNRDYELAMQDIRASLKRAGETYFDLYLMHSAIGGPEVRKEVWKALCDAKKEGWLYSIGVSNFGAKHIQEFVDQKVPLPTVNQIDLHPFMRHPEIVKICEDNGILLESWGPLARAMRFNHSVVQSIAKKHGKDEAQIMLRWGLQHGFVIIPKSVSPKRIKSNAQIFDFEISSEG